MYIHIFYTHLFEYIYSHISIKISKNTQVCFYLDIFTFLCSLFFELDFVEYTYGYLYE